MNTDKSRIEQGSREYDRLVERLIPIYNCVKSDEYNKILTALCSKDIDSIVDILLSVYQDRKAARMEIIRVQGELQAAQFDGIVADKDLQIQLSESQKREEQLWLKSIGMSQLEAKSMKLDYEQGKSLRELAKKYHCDKATVKRRLIKMGTVIRERE